VRLVKALCLSVYFFLSLLPGVLQAEAPECKPISFLTDEENSWLCAHPILSAQNERDWPPYNFERNGTPRGYSIDLFDRMARKLHVQVRYESGKTWKEYLRDLRQGKLDVMLNIRRTSERSRWILFSDPYAEASKSIFTNLQGIHNLSDLRGKRVAVPDGYYIEEFLHRYYPQIRVVPRPDLTQAIYAVANGQADAVVEDYNAVATLMQQLGVVLRYATVIRDRRIENGIRMGVRKDRKLLSSILRKTMRRLSAEERAELRAKWLNSEKIEWRDYGTLDLDGGEVAFLRSHPVIPMCNNPNWVPIEFLDPKTHRMEGIAIDTLHWIEKKLHVRFVHVPTESWSQSQQFLEEGKCMILPAAIRTKSRDRYARFTRPYLQYELAIITRKDAPFIRNLDDLKGKIFARKKGSGLIAKMRRLYPGIKILETRNYLESFQAVLDGRADYTIATLPVAAYFISRYQLNDLVISGYTDMRYDLSIAVAKDQAQLVGILDKALQALPAAERKAIFNKWTDIHLSRKMHGIDPKILYTLLAVGTLALLLGGFWYLQLRKSARESRELLDATLEGVVLLQEGKVVDVNQSMLKLLGYAYRREMIGRKFLDWVAPRSVEAVRRHSGKEYNEPYEVVMKRADGTLIHTLVFGRYIRHRSMRLVNVVDITRLKEQERLIAQQSKLASMGEMIGNIAHQWRQPLSIISSITTGLKLKKLHGILKDEEFFRQCDDVKRQVDYLSRTIDDFRDFIRGTHVVRTYKIEEIFERFMKLVEGSREKSEIMLIVHNRIRSELIGYPNELIQCLLNLYNNAQDAFADRRGERVILIEADEKEEKASIKFMDSAGGIDAEILPMIFDPYFTTKHQTQGTGLGLYMTHQLLKGMGGNIWAENCRFIVDSKRFYGACFLLGIPKTIEKEVPVDQEVDSVDGADEMNRIEQ